MFRAVRPSSGFAAGPAKIVTGIHSTVTEWMIRRTSGEMVRFRELTTLQRWIVERKVTRVDEISKTGKKWEKLGNIPELAIFFQVIENQGGALPDPIADDTEPMPVVPLVTRDDDDVALPPSREWSANPPPAIPVAIKPSWPVDKPWVPMHGGVVVPPPPPKPTDPGIQVPFRSGADPFSETLPDPTGVNPVIDGPPKPAMPGPAMEAGETRQETVRWDLAPNLPDDVREEYEVGGGRPGRETLVPKRSHAGQTLMVIAAVALGALAITYVMRPAWLTSIYRRYVAGVPPAAIHSVEEAYTALLLDTGASIDTAVEKLEAALGLDGSYGAARAGLAEALAVRADAGRELADLRGALLAATPAVDPAPELAALAELRRKAEADLERARAEAAQALDIDSAGLASNRAMLEVVRLGGDRNRIDQLAMIAHAAGPDDVRLNIIMAEIALPEPSQADRVQKHLQDALAKEPRANHARYLLARLHLARDRKDEAMAALKELVAATPAHERGVALLKSLEQGLPAQPQVGTPTPETPVADGPTADKPTADGPTADKPTADKPIADAPTTEKPATDKPATEVPPTGPKTADDPSLTFAEAISRGERLRESDKPTLAVRYYERAAVLNPRDPDAHLGVGFCRLDLRETNAAIAAFRRAIDLSPRFSDAHFGLAEAYRARGNKIYAIRYYKQYLDIAPHGPDSDVARSQLAKLEDDNSEVPTPPPAPQPSVPEPPPPPPAPSP
ncbi:MAG: tetratricopeptide repeat protein [Myxococcota bacterium]